MGLYRRRAALGAAAALILGLAGALPFHPVRAQTTSVTIQNFAFSPATLTIPAGTTVTWTNMDSVGHTATADSGAWTTPLIQQGQSAGISFTQPGTFTYHCSVHPNMHGTIVVQSASTATTGSTGATATATAAPAATATAPAPATTSVPLSATLVSPARVFAKEKHDKYVFSPAKMTVKVGQRVIWKNSTDAGHTVTSTSAGWTYNRQLGEEKSLTVTFTKAGTYHYKCIYHPGMVGTITVTG